MNKNNIEVLNKHENVKKLLKSKKLIDYNVKSISIAFILIKKLI